MNHSEVARELAEAAIGPMEHWAFKCQWSNSIEEAAAMFEPILRKHYGDAASQPVAMEAVVERIANRVCLSEAVPDDHADYMLTILRRILAAELAPVETLLREWQKHLRRENNLSPSKHTEELISQIDTILGGQHGTCE